MVKLPRYPVRPSPSWQSFNTDDRAPVIEPANRQASNMGIDGAHVNGGMRHTSILQEMRAQDLPVNVEVEAVLKANDIDAVTRVSHDDMRTRRNEIDPRAVVATLYDSNLAHGLLSFVAPRLRHPDVLHAARQGGVLERLVGTLSTVLEDSMPRESIVVLQQELQRLILLRENRNSLIKG
ncbi:hypothetical protein AA309_12380 [Microvirga vignae]|uniref:Uncharacterized protein n=1 Tax=Microvirga vignae TaxID=1225564 RepID=A0A0H1RC97_9HYPH|nr:hypothetical protein [Microvirga vignae]KLK92815.1 hypothetical protein AA309_12380 [Microvirga vignae]